MLAKGAGKDEVEAPGGGSCLHPADQPKKAMLAAATTTIPVAHAACPLEGVAGS
jgi:hypothetical protein